MIERVASWFTGRVLARLTDGQCYGCVLIATGVAALRQSLEGHDLSAVYIAAVGLALLGTTYAIVNRRTG